MSDSLDLIDPDSIPQRFMPELRSIDFRYDSDSRRFYFQPYPVDCDVILCNATDIYTFGISIGMDGESVCSLDNFPAISPAAGAIWLHRGSLNQWRLLAVWGDPLQLALHDDAPDVTDYLIHAKAAPLDR
jgi:hypothetical protein